MSDYCYRQKPEEWLENVWVNWEIRWQNAQGSLRKTSIAVQSHSAVIPESIVPTLDSFGHNSEIFPYFLGVCNDSWLLWRGCLWENKRKTKKKEEEANKNSCGIPSIKHWLEFEFLFPRLLSFFFFFFFMLMLIAYWRNWLKKICIIFRSTLPPLENSLST